MEKKKIKIVIKKAAPGTKENILKKKHAREVGEAGKTGLSSDVKPDLKAKVQETSSTPGSASEAEKKKVLNSEKPLVAKKEDIVKKTSNRPENVYRAPAKPGPETLRKRTIVKQEVFQKVKPALKKANTPIAKKSVRPTGKKTTRVKFELPPKKTAAKKRSFQARKRSTSQNQGRKPENKMGKDGLALKSGELLNFAQTGFKTPNKKAGGSGGGSGYQGRRRGGGDDKRKQASNLRYPVYNKTPKKKADAVVPKNIEILEHLTIGDLAKKLNVKASILIGKLMKMGMMGTINQVIDAETATLLASEYDCEVKIISLYEETLIGEENGEDSDINSRAPIVTVMGHVDHGKTKLLDCIRHQDVAAGEAGGITQHIGAYRVTLPEGDIVFLDTPGHAAFTSMRARGSQVTDMVILVVAADDGVMPQTLEAISHSKAANVPIIVAVNKIDKPGIDTQKIKQELASHGLNPEEWGGETQFVEISALKGLNIDKLLEAVLLQSEMLELKANDKTRAVGTVLEARLDSGRGPLSHIIIQKGIIKQGDSVVAGRFAGKVRAMFNDSGERLKVAGPSTPVEILGIDGVPEAGDPFHVMDSEKSARTISGKRLEMDRYQRALDVKKVTLDDLNDMLAEGEFKEVNIILKADVRGSVEALSESLVKIKRDNIKVKVIHSGAGAIIESDVMLAAASNAIIIGFHVRPNAKSQAMAEKEGVEIKYYKVIYEVLEDIEKALDGMLEPEFKEVIDGTAEIREIFKISKLGNIAGCKVMTGKINKSNSVRIIRNGIVKYDGTLKSLRRVKDEVNEVLQGFECGLFLEDFNDFKVGDSIESYKMETITKSS